MEYEYGSETLFIQEKYYYNDGYFSCIEMSS